MAARRTALSDHALSEDGWLMVAELPYGADSVLRLEDKETTTAKSVAERHSCIIGADVLYKTRVGRDSVQLIKIFSRRYE